MDLAQSAAVALDFIRRKHTGVDISDVQKLMQDLETFTDAFERDPTLLSIYFRTFEAWTKQEFSKVPQLIKQIKSVRRRLRNALGQYKRGVSAPDAPRLRDFCVKLSKQAQVQRVVG